MIVIRSAMTSQTNCMDALHSLLYGHGRHYLFQTHRTGYQYKEDMYNEGRFHHRTVSAAP